MTDQEARRVEVASLVSVVLTAIAITLNHLYTLGAGAVGLGGALVALSAASWWRFRAKADRRALAAYLLLNLWIVVGFGLIKGFWLTTLNIFVGTLLSSMSTSFPRPSFSSIGFEMSGVVMFIGSLFVLYYGIQLAPWLSRLRSGTLALGGFLAVAAIAGAFVIADRDVWVRPANRIVRIGVIVPTEGPYAMLGTSFVKAVEMARDDLRNTRFRYELVIHDSGPDPVKARDVIRKMIDDDRVDAIVGGISLIGQQTKPFATRARIPHLCVCTVSWIGDGAYNFTNIASPESEGALWSQEARRRGIRTVALVTQDYPSINNHVKALKVEAARVGLAILDDQTFPSGVTDFESIINRAEAGSPDVYYVEALEPQLDLLGAQFSQAGIRNIAAVVAFSLSDTPELFEGTWYTDSNLRDPAFKQRFETKYPGIRFANHMMPYAYDSVNMIVQAFEHEQNPSVYLRNLRTYEGTAGPLTKSAGSGHFASTPAVWTIVGGKPALVNR